MSNTALNRTTAALLTNKSGGNLNYGAVVIVDDGTAKSFTTTTSGGYSDGLVGVIIEPNGIADDEFGLVATAGWVPRINLESAAAIGELIATHTVAGQGTPHAAPQDEGDFAQALQASATPEAILFGAPNGAAGGGGGGNVNAGGTLTNNALVIGQGSQDVATTTTGTGVLAMLGANVGGVGAIGGWTRIAQIVTSGSQATVDFSSIPSIYAALVVQWISQDTASGTGRSTVRVKVNNDGTSGNYTSAQRIGAQGGAAYNDTLAASALGVQVGIHPNAGSTAMAGTGTLIIIGYAQTTWQKVLTSVMGSSDDAVGSNAATIVARWKATSAIDRLTFGTDGTAFLDGSIFTVFGVR